MLRLILAATLGLLAGCAQPLPVPGGASFSFAFIGDVPYGAGAEQRFARMLEHIGEDPSIRFLLHAGDLKGSGEPCSDELLGRRLAQLRDVRSALVYTPGDNDWTDCHRAGAGGHDPLERLQALRRLAYPQPNRSLGRAPLALHAQAGYPENVQFAYGRIAFVTLHVTGSNNGLDAWRAPTQAGTGAAGDAQLAAFRQREAANLAWLTGAFASARADDALGVVVLMHANPRFGLPRGDAGRAGFEAIVEALGNLAAAFGRPVLLLHGDGHLYRVDRPLADASPPVPKLRRVQAFGHPWLAWIRIDVDAASAEVFRIGIGAQHDVIGG
jgi:hypothetical protein